MVCVDTSFIIALIRRDSQAESKLEQLTREAERIFTTPICACELFAGAYKSTKKDLEIRKVREILSRMELLEFSIQACERFGRIREQMHTGGATIGDLDIMIASIALTNSQPILTRDTRHFEKVPGLDVETW
jgi:tRNA(fMet)-specific endonuclease VapC